MVRNARAISKRKHGIVLLGPYYSGKTSCSRLLSRKLGWRVFDLDEMYTQRHSESIWATRNLPNGLKLAAKRRDEIAKEIMANMNDGHSVVVFGGGSVFKDHPKWVDEVKQTHIVVFLAPSRETLVNRALRDKSQAESQFIFRDADAHIIDLYFEKFFKSRGSDYIHWADRIIEPGSDWSVEEVCFQVLACYLNESVYQKLQ